KSSFAQFNCSTPKVSWSQPVILLRCCERPIIYGLFVLFAEEHHQPCSLCHLLKSERTKRAFSCLVFCFSHQVAEASGAILHLWQTSFPVRHRLGHDRSRREVRAT